MHRTLAVLLVVGLFLVAGGAALGETVILDELVPWPLMSAGISAEALLLSDEPIEPISGWHEFADIAAVRVRFGLMPIGTTDDPGISFLFLESKTPQIVIDSDNDENLANNGIVSPREQISSRSYSWFATVSGEYQDGESTIVSESHINIAALYSYEDDGYIIGYSGFCQRRGSFVVEGKSVSISITSLLPNVTYDVSQLVVAVDGDFDGYIDSLPGSHEVFGPGEDIQIGTMRYRLTQVTAWGGSLSLEPIGIAPPLSPIAAGETAPAFTTISVTGEKLSLSMFSEDVVVMQFLPSLEGADCSSCVSNDPFLKRLVSIYDALQSFDNVVILAVVPTSVIPEELYQLPSGRIHYVVDPALTAQYRRNYGTIIISPDGTIAAMDEAWATFKCNRPHGKFDELRISEIAAVVQRLLQDVHAP